MKILMAGLFTGNSFDGDEILATGFSQLGHQVTKINYREFPFINFRLPKMSKAFDLLVIGKGEAIWPITLKKITTPKILWYGDQRENTQQWVVNRAKYCDLFLHTTAGERLNEYAKACKRPSAFFMVPCDPTLYDDNLVYKQDIFYSGSPLSNLGDDIRKDTLQELLKYNNFKWAGQTPDSVVKGADYAQAITQSKVTISVNHFNYFSKYNSDRIIHYSAGAFVLAYAVPEINELFSHIPTFESMESLSEKVAYFLKNEEEREDLKQKIINETRVKYNSKRMCQYILDLLLKNDASEFVSFEYIR